MTPHISASKEEIASNVIMPGDPKRAKFIAENYLEGYRLVNEIRGMLAYTGTYRGKNITVMASGMGMGSMGIYSYELFTEYDVENIIRIGTCGAYSENLKLKDVVLVDSSYAVTDYDTLISGTDSPVLKSSFILNSRIKNTAREKNIKLTVGRTHCTDAFYTYNSDSPNSRDKYYYEYNCIAVEMEAFALFQNANVANKQATCILTVSDSLITKESISSEEREKSLRIMIELALDSI